MFEKGRQGIPSIPQSLMASTSTAAVFLRTRTHNSLCNFVATSLTLYYLQQWLEAGGELCFITTSTPIAWILNSRLRPKPSLPVTSFVASVNSVSITVWWCIKRLIIWEERRLFKQKSKSLLIVSIRISCMKYVLRVCLSMTSRCQSEAQAERIAIV